jgi:hypothetical protein
MEVETFWTPSDFILESILIPNDTKTALVVTFFTSYKKGLFPLEPVGS